MFEFLCRYETVAIFVENSKQASRAFFNAIFFRSTDGYSLECKPDELLVCLLVHFLHHLAEFAEVDFSVPIVVELIDQIQKLNQGLQE